MTGQLRSGAVEALKWGALAAMVVDHVNAAFFARELGTWATATGRVAMPLFALVLAYNLARPGADIRGCLRRLVLFGLLAWPGYVLVFDTIGGWWPLNILFTFAVGVGVLELLRVDRHALALALFLVGGALVEYWWPGVALVVAGVLHFRSSTSTTAILLAASLAGLCLVNGNAWALLAVPVLLAARYFTADVPRLRRVFWWFYPAHLAVLVAMTALAG